MCFICLQGAQDRGRRRLLSEEDLSGYVQRRRSGIGSRGLWIGVARQCVTRPLNVMGAGSSQTKTLGSEREGRARPSLMSRQARVLPPRAV